MTPTRARRRITKLRSPKETAIAKDQNTFAKRKREIEKKAKAEAKRARRSQRKLELEADANRGDDSPDAEDPDAEGPHAEVQDSDEDATGAS